MNNSKNTIAWIILISAPLVVIMLSLDHSESREIMLALAALCLLIISIVALVYYKKGKGAKQERGEATPPTPAQKPAPSVKTRKDEVKERPAESPRPQVTRVGPMNDDRMAEYRRAQQIEAEKRRRQTDAIAQMEDRYSHLMRRGARDQTDALAILNDVELFLQEYEETMNKDTGYVSVWRLWYHVGSLCLDVFLFDEAMQCYENGINNKFTDNQRQEATKEYHAMKALVDRQRKATNKIEGGNDNDKAKAHLERALLPNTRRSDALADLDAASELDDSLIEIQFYKGVKCQRKGWYETAVQCFSKVIEGKSEYYNESSSYYRRAECYQALKQYEKAVEDFSSVIELNPNDYDAYSSRSFVYRLLGKTSEAEKDSATYNSLYEEQSYIPGGQIDLGDYSEHLTCNGHSFDRILGE